MKGEKIGVEKERVIVPVIVLSTIFKNKKKQKYGLHAGIRINTYLSK